MEFKELALQRRSMRAYSEAIGREELEAILETAQQAPSWKNWQASRCYAVVSTELLESFREKALPPFNQKNTQNAALIVTTFLKDRVGFSKGVPENEAENHWGAYDLGLHDAYLVLAAKDAGYDTLIMGIRDADAIREALQIPENEQIMSVIAVGRGAQEPVHFPRKAPEEVIRFF